jgi:putative ATP-binding cassette transporter
MKIVAFFKARGKTVLVISHDDRYYPLADRVIKLDEGHVVSDAKPLAMASGRFVVASTQ